MGWRSEGGSEGHEPCSPFSPVRGYTALRCGISPDVTVVDGGRYAVPWGRWHPVPRKDILASLESEKEGGTGEAENFCDWCEEKTSEYA